MLDEGVRAGGDECRIRLCFTLRKPTPTALTTLTATHSCIPLVIIPFSPIVKRKGKEKKAGIFSLPGQQNIISPLYLKQPKNGPYFAAS